MSVQRLEPAHYPRAASVLAAAFDVDPAFRFVLPDDETRPARLEWIMLRWLRAMAPRADAYQTECGNGVALWLPPHAPADASLATMVRVGLLALPFKIGVSALRRFLALDDDIKARHRDELDRPRFVLDIIGVRPQHHNRGLGKQLLAPGLARADREGLGAYLITHNPNNLPFYRRFGFGVLTERPACPDGPVAWSLVRPPAAA